jgi:hypothetical protein
LGTRPTQIRRSIKKVAAGATGQADLAIAMIAKLYAIEKQIQHCDAQERKSIR